MPTRVAIRCSLLLLATLAMLAPDAYAMQRTFVASYGNDANPCSPIKPCRSFAVAFGRTDPAGEMIVLDSAGYGSVNINQALTIKAPPGVYGGITIGNVNGITINAPGHNVTLSGLTINGISINSPAGVHIDAASIVNIDHCFIKGAVLGAGIEASTSTLYVNDTTLEGNPGGGIMLSGNAVGHLDNVAVRDNSGWGVLVGSSASVTISRSFISDQQRGVEVQSFTAASPLPSLTIADSVAANNSVFGVQIQANGGPGSVAWLDRTMLFANGAAFNAMASGDTASVAFATVRRTMAAANTTGIHSGAFFNETAVVAVTQSVAAGNATDGLGQTTGATLFTRQNNMVHGNNGGDANPQTFGTLTPLAPL